MIILWIGYLIRFWHIKRPRMLLMNSLGPIPLQVSRVSAFIQIWWCQSSVSESTAPNASQSSSQTTGESSETSEPTSSDLHGKEKKGHDVFNYNCALLADGLFFLNFLDAISEGDGLRVMRQYKYMLLYCRADGQLSNKYALVCLYQSFYINSLFSPRDCERLVWNRSVNNKGGRGNNIAHDLEVEHSNLYNKGGIRNLGPNVTEKAVQALCKPPKANWKTSLFISLLDVSLLYQ